MESKPLGKSGLQIPVIGMGTWGIGGFGSPLHRNEDAEIEALRFGIRLGLGFIDTAEIYGHGHSEEVVAKAVTSQRDQIFIATKVSAEHLNYDNVLKAAERSLRRLNTLWIDLYQVHWPNPRIPIAETMRAMERLVEDGKVRYIGVSNFSVEEMSEAQAALSKNSLQANQVEYSLMDRSIEADVLPYCQREKITVIAYSPLARGALARSNSSASNQLAGFGKKYGKDAVQVALRWLIDQDQVVAIPKSAKINHIEQIAGTIGWSLDKNDHSAIARAFPQQGG